LDGERELRRVARPIAKKTISLKTNKSLDLRQWNTFSIDLSSIIAPEPGAIYTVKIKFNKNYSLYSTCASAEQDIDENYMTENIDDELPKDDYHNTYYYYDDDYDYYYTSDDPCSDYYYRGKRFVSQNILASDIGLVVKRGNDRNYLVFATNLVTAEPMSGVKIVFYNYQQQKIGEGSTGSNGVVQLELKESPHVLMGQDGAQKSYLRITDEQSLSLSTFDVSGTSVENGLKGFIYGERGVWRPGDTLFLTFVMEDRANRLPENHPVTFELYNVQNQLVYKQVRTEGQNGFYSFACPTDDDAPTGNWNAYAKVGGVTFSKSLRVATVKPNRLKIDTKLDHDPVQAGQAVSGTINAKWLHGAPTNGNEADITVRLNPVRTTFKGYQDYIFDDVTKRFGGSEEMERSGRLNENGNMNFNIPINESDEYSGKLRASIAVRVFEEGGEFSTDNFSVDVYPYSSFVGLKMPKGIGYYNRLETGKDQLFEVVTLDADGKPLKRALDVSIYRSEWSWWWFSSDGSLADYAYRIYDNEVYSTKITTNANGIGSVSYKLTYPDWGLFLVKVTDPQSGHSTVQKMYIDWWGYGRGDDNSSAGVSVLSFRTDKDKYNVGEKVTVTVPSTAGAKLLVTVENGSRVLSSTRMDCKGDETKVELTATAEMTPNAYIYIALIQPHRQTKNDLPMRLYGVIPLMVEDPATRLAPEINAPDVFRPEQSFTVKVKESKGKDMTYTLAIVDEGLLDLTRFKTPDLWEHFFQREALGVRTWDLYNYVLGAYGGKIEQLFAIGGGDEMDGKKGGEKANRFKPVVKFAGPFTLKGGKTNSHNFTINNYVGSVRVMLVGGNGQAYGNSEKTVPVRSPLMVQATLPRVLGPGEEVTLPATIFAMEKQVKDVKIELKLDDMFEPLDGTNRNLTFKETGDEMVRFKLKVKNKLGIARVKIIATSGSERAENTIEIDVRAANPPVIVSDEKIVSANQSTSFALKTPGMEGTNTMQLEVSSIPPINLGTRLQYLIAYPHGCLEQTTSSVFPQLYLGDVVDMPNSMKELMKKNVEAALKRLTYFVKSDGSFSYWPGGTGYGCEWTNNYAGHFLMEAERKGYKIPGNMKDNWISYQQKAARNWSASTDDNRYGYNQNDLVQAYRLYVLALAKKQELGAMNRLKERSDLSIQAKWMLAGAYALAGQPEAGKKIIEDLSVETKSSYNGSSNTYGSPDRDDAITLDILTLLGLKEKAFIIAQRISKALSSDYWLGTQTTAYCLMGISKFALSETSGLSFAYTVGNGKTETVSSKKSVWNIDLGSREGTVNLKFDNKAEATLFVRLTAKGVPIQGEEVASEKDLKLTVRYMDNNERSIDVSRLPQGTDFYAEVRISNPGQRGHYSNLALTQIFPSGWEITENRLEDEDRNDGVTYRDIRDDRVFSYFDLRRGNSLTVKVKLRAAYIGKFYLPAVACEAMYDNTIYANTTGQSVEVY
ncbi:MAG: MG2 domain-containing protein, partial [Bacteroidales bacterium]|nr:MG2 domain-containing protein [Bacteroidales bacterium]